MTNWRERRLGKRWRASSTREQDEAAAAAAVVVQGPAPIIFCLRTSAQARAEEALEALAGLVKTAASEHVRVSAANAILDRAFGKPLTGARAAEEDADDEDEDEDGIEVQWLGGGNG